MKKILFLIFFISLNTQARDSRRPDTKNYGFFVGAFGASATDDGSGAEKSKGTSLGANLGYRWRIFALELNSLSSELKLNGGQAEEYFIERGEFKLTGFELGLKIFILRYFQLGFGVSKANLEYDVYAVENMTSNPIVRQSDIDMQGTYASLAVVVPIFRNLDFWIFHKRRNLKDPIGLTLNESIKMSETGVNLIFYFR